MSRGPRAWRPAAAALLLAWIQGQSFGQEQIIRVLPDDGKAGVQAQWRTPRPETGGLPARTEMFGRVSAAAAGGLAAGGENLLDAQTDSNLTIRQPLGAGAQLQLTARALRNRGVETTRQAYEGGLDLLAERWSLEADGSFRQDEGEVESLSSRGQDAVLQGKLSTTLLPTLPISLSYAHNFTDREQSDPTPASSQSRVLSDVVLLKAAGTLGSMELDLEGALEDATDEETSTRSLGASGLLSLGLPVSRFLQVRLGLIPVFNNVEYLSTGAALSTRSLESSLGLVIPLSGNLEYRLAAGRVDAWSQQEGPLAGSGDPPYRQTWKGTTGLSLEAPAGLFGLAQYGLAKTLDGSLAHKAEGGLGYRGSGSAALREIGLGGTYALTLSEAGAKTQEEGIWEAVLRLEPSQRLGLSASYDGRLLAAGGESWQQRLSASVSHRPLPGMNYLLEASFSGSGGPGLEDSLIHEYRGRLELRPPPLLMDASLWLEELVGLAGAPPAGELLSRATAGFTLLARAGFSVHYSLQWEWLNHTSPQGPGGHAFKHTPGLALRSGPVNLTLDYALGHGFRGLRHDLSAGLLLPLGGSFALQAAAQFASYQEEASPVLPWLASLGLAYEF